MRKLLKDTSGSRLQIVKSWFVRCEKKGRAGPEIYKAPENNMFCEYVPPPSGCLLEFLARLQAIYNLTTSREAEYATLSCFDQGCGVGGKTSDSPPFQNFRPRLLNISWREWNLAVKINGSLGTQQEISDSTKVSKNCTISTGIPDLGIGHPESDKKIRLRLPVLLGIRLRLLTTPTLDPGSATWFWPEQMLETQLFGRFRTNHCTVRK